MIQRKMVIRRMAAEATGMAEIREADLRGWFMALSMLEVAAKIRRVSGHRRTPGSVDIMQRAAKAILKDCPLASVRRIASE